MTVQLPGIHHVTAIVDNPQDNLNFYAGVLGLRFIKRTVNFDDPSTYHLYFGDEVGTPGTIITFFPIIGAMRGVRGAGQATAFALTIPQGSSGYWQQRLADSGIHASDPQPRFDEQVITLHDPAGLLVELVTHPDAEQWQPWTGAGVPAEHAIRNAHSITLTVNNAVPTSNLLTDVLGFREVARAGNRTRFATGEGGSSMLVDVVADATIPRGRVAAGTIHHIAWRTPSDEQQLAWLQLLRKAGLQVTLVQDRNYFHSIYFREPAGILYEIATDTPGFAVDEPVAELGQSLKLPSWLEPRRSTIEASLDPLTLPTEVRL